MSKLAVPPVAALKKTASRKASASRARGVPAEGPFVTPPDFLLAFRADAMERVRLVKHGVPATFVITAQYPAFIGVSAILAERLAG